MTDHPATRTWANDPAAWLNVVVKVALIVSFAIAIVATPDVTPLVISSSHPPVG